MTEGGVESLRHIAGVGATFSPSKGPRPARPKAQMSLLHKPITDPTYVAVLTARQGAGDLRNKMLSFAARLPVQTIMSVQVKQL